jgi:D-alanine-D-alanine ligase
LEFPAIAKPVALLPHESSEPWIAHDETSLRDRVAEIVAQRRQAVVVETYVQGRELVLGLVGEQRPKVLPVMEVIHDSARQHPFLARELYRAGVECQVPAEIEPGIARRLARVARLVFATLGCRDVARVLFRIDDAGTVWFLSCNPLPSLAPGKADFVRMAKAAGMDFRSLVGEIMAPALRRLRAQQRTRLLSASA